MIDKSQWKLDDPEWVKKRKEDWLIMYRYFDNKRFYNEKTDPEDFKHENDRINSYELFFKEGILNEEHTSWQDLPLLMPDPSVEDIRYILSIQNYGNGYTLPYGEGHLGLLNAGLITEKHRLNILIAYSGETIEELCNIHSVRGYKPEDLVVSAVKSLLPSMSGLIKRRQPKDFPYNIFLSHYKSIFKYINESNFEDCTFRLNKHCRTIGWYVDGNKEKIDAEQLDNEEIFRMVSDLQSLLKSEEVYSGINEIASRYF